MNFDAPNHLEASGKASPCAITKRPCCGAPAALVWVSGTRLYHRFAFPCRFFSCREGPSQKCNMCLLARWTRPSARSWRPMAARAFLPAAPICWLQMRAGVVQPGLIVDIKSIPETTAIEEDLTTVYLIGARFRRAAGGIPALRQGLAWRGSKPVNLIGLQAGAGAAPPSAVICATPHPPPTACRALVVAGAVANAQGPNG